MPVALRDLLLDPSLRLRLRAGASALERVVRCVAVTELADPTPWMTGGELVLTTGLRQRTAGAQSAFVERMATAGASGIGFGIGLSHPAVPRATVVEAERLGVAVLEVPYETPFIAINQLVVERVSAEDHSRQRRLVEQHDLLAEALLSGDGLVGLLRALRRTTGCEVAVVDRHGVLLAGVPQRAARLAAAVGAGAGGAGAGGAGAGGAGAGWAGAGGAGAGGAAGPGLAASGLAAPGLAASGLAAPGLAGSGLAAPDSAAIGLVDRDSPICLPVPVDGIVVAHLCLRSIGDAADVLPFAVRLVGLELARRQSLLAGRRELVGQVLQDIVRDVIEPATAERRLEAFGLDPKRAHRVILGCLAPGDAGRPPDAGAQDGGLGGAPGGKMDGQQDDQRLARLPWSTGSRPGGAEPVLTAVVGRYLVAVLPQAKPAQEVAPQLAGLLSAVDRRAAVGIGGSYRGVDGLRWSYLEAQAALGRGPGVHQGDPLNLPRLLLSNPDLPLRQLGAEVLRPLTEFDAAHRGELVATLHGYLTADCSVQAVADQLCVHRNTVRYRLDQIERLTGRSLGSMQDRVQLWLALLACGEQHEQGQQGQQRGQREHGR
ncbi:purine catabolism regulator [Kitasatospora sp. MAP12-15]|uniref:PucR family transcriptional regulator n=1 Tax=unclassified Kitasatospora TaxID=2633591 RepID=UPI002475FCE9|nr:PucR family transcriptional regulator [Kitasatospora sp. MAP12-44]MDH6115035.1 purine catabolism regulator [Kitasatospora sp. MAP12-44]